LSVDCSMVIALPSAAMLASPAVTLPPLGRVAWAELVASHRPSAPPREAKRRRPRARGCAGRDGADDETEDENMEWCAGGIGKGRCTLWEGHEPTMDQKNYFFQSVCRPIMGDDSLFTKRWERRGRWVGRARDAGRRCGSPEEGEWGTRREAPQLEPGITREGRTADRRFRRGGSRRRGPPAELPYGPRLAVGSRPNGEGG
jgi:hypothetical protein